MKKVLTRTLTGLVYIAVIVACILGGPLWMMLLCLVLGALATAELSAITTAPDTPRPGLTAALDMLGVLLLVAVPYLGRAAYLGEILVPLWMLWLVVRLVAELYLHNPNPVAALGRSMLAQLWIALPLTLFQLIYAFDNGKMMTLLIFIMIWLNDTGAFCVGSLCGRRRLFERISPKKSWEGFWGGCAFAILGGVVAAYIEGGGVLWWKLPLMGLLVSVFATWGDLIESLLKRSCHVKDSGNILPGHGGILDRIDSLLLVAPAMFIYFLLTGL